MKLLVVNGSPRVGSSTEILAEEFIRGFVSAAPATEVVSVRLNDLEIIPCQACAVDPRPLLCIYKDELYPFLDHLKAADFLLIATPIYFDTVSSQTKLFIDRCNCFRPPKFENGRCVFDNEGILNSRGAYILVGGAREKYDAARRVIHGFFIWTGIENAGSITYAHDEEPLGAVAGDSDKLRECFDFGAECARKSSASA